MNLSELIQDLPRALQAGQQLANPETYHNAANFGAALLILFNVAIEIAKAFNVDLHLEPATVSSLANGISGVTVAVIGVIHTAASKHAGFKK